MTSVGGGWRAALLAAALLMGLAVETKAAPVVVDDSMAQRLLACTGCHGREGRAAADGYRPRLAGKPAGYLYNQLRNFSDGRRRYPLMTDLLEPLSDAYLHEIAAHFAKLDLPYPPPVASSAEPAVLSRGRALVFDGDKARRIPACAGCHGAALTGVEPAVPGLLGLPRDYLNGQLGAWRTGARHAQAPDCMAQVAQALAEADIHALSQWLAAQPLPASTHPAPSLPAAMPLECGGTPARVTP